ncbi:GNAT family N-acetyltransferase [Bacillus sp. FJAT-49736]|uniref:GNAT family N-acetyltransferase n=1 Tax=Bacillus sp. FJAT-49736 TaxID=2833582 RepID=UPI001BC9F026|nr:GNAT family N-acetyltransferase [Bacillus sp. FJAT-49736]MBS4172739.1 GNAT family N-acetyltransferase [Bacillus sp. FJAT-49736]
MEFLTIQDWDFSLWTEAEKIYEEAFPAHNRKKRDIIQHMFKKNMCYLHLAFEDSKIVGMALSGKTDQQDVLILDYIAVKENLQHQGIGRKLVEYIKEWCFASGNFSLLVVEVEAEENAQNEKRIQFWQKCGFHLTDYIHSYIWVPETYKAMYFSTKALNKNPNGTELFSYITDFHKKSYQRG